MKYESRMKFNYALDANTYIHNPMCKSNLKNAVELKLLRENFVVHTIVLYDLCIKDSRFIQNKIVITIDAHVIR